MNPITPTTIYEIKEAPSSFQRINEFTPEEKGVLHYLERRENMIVMTAEEFEQLKKKYFDMGFKIG